MGDRLPAMQISPPPPSNNIIRLSLLQHSGWAQGFQTAFRSNSSESSAIRSFATSVPVHGTLWHEWIPEQFCSAELCTQVQCKSKGKEVATEQWDDAAFDRVFDQVSNALYAEAGSNGCGERFLYANGTSTPYQRGASTGNASVTELLGGRVVEGDLDHDLAYQQELAEIENAHAENLQRIRQRQEEALSRPEVLQRLESDPIAEEMLREDLDSAMASDSEMEQQKQQQDDDALAKTAQELLEKVEHNNTDKFRNSQFLTLMRKLRDREMKSGRQRHGGNEMCVLPHQ